MAAPTNILTADQALAHATHATGLDSLKVDSLQLLNNAGYHLVNMHPWNWLTPQTAWLSGRANISIGTATWTEATKTLTQVGAFADYTFVDGDIFEATGGTNVITGATGGKHVVVASRVDDDSITLAESISSTAADLGTGDITGTLHTPRIEMPSDFGAIQHLTSTNSLVNNIQLVPHSEIALLRTNQIEVTSSWSYRAAVTYVGSPPRPVLDVYPDIISDNANDIFQMFYKKSWNRLSSLSATVDIPDFCNALYLQLVRAFALGYEDEDQANLEQRLLQLEAGMLFKNAREFDRVVQAAYGRMRGGAVKPSARRYGPNALATEISGPS